MSGGVDRAIRISTAAAVVGVAGIAAYVSYQHAFEVVRAHRESGLTARLEPATIDGLVYSSSMVILYAARHRLPVPGLARWLLALGIMATLAANVVHGWPDGPIGAIVAAWPAASLVGSYELLLWLIRTSAARVMVRDGVSGQVGEPADQWPLQMPDPAVAEGTSGPDAVTLAVPAAVDHASGPAGTEEGNVDRSADQQAASRPETNGLSPANRSRRRRRSS